MGLFWELFQQSQISNRRQHAEDLESRVAVLEEELLSTQDLLSRTLERLERLTNKDFNEDGNISAPLEVK